MCVSNVELDQVSFEFFKRFSRWEYALKSTGCVNARNGVSADYSKFIDRIPDSKINNLSECAMQLLLLKPKKQRCRSNGEGLELYWEPSSYAGDLMGVIGCLNVVRNNLFHGGKLGIHGWEDDKTRVKNLLTCGICVIDEIASFDNEIQNAYDGIC